MSNDGEMIYAVHRLNWRVIESGFVRLPGSTRLRSFDDYNSAEEFRQKQEEAIRAKVNPFRFGGPTIFYQTSLDLPRLHDWLLDADLEPPTLNRRPEDVDWISWWDKEAPKFSDYQRAKVWEALDKVRFFEVVHRPQCETVFIVSAFQWEYNDSWYDCETEGGEPIKAFRSRESAEKHRLELEEQIKRDWEGRFFDPTAREWHRQDPFHPANLAEEESPVEIEQTQFYEVIEVEWNG